jgi:hypothetical protein
MGPFIRGFICAYTWIHQDATGPTLATVILETRHAAVWSDPLLVTGKRAEMMVLAIVAGVDLRFVIVDDLTHIVIFPRGAPRAARIVPIEDRETTDRELEGQRP